MDLSGSYSCMSVNSDMSPVNSDLSSVNSDLLPLFVEIVFVNSILSVCAFYLSVYQSVSA